MSYYDDNDHNRSAGGQFHDHVNAGVGEQLAAGVNSNDSFMLAHLKTQQYRLRNNLDPGTGLALPIPRSSHGTSVGYGEFQAYSGPPGGHFGQAIRLLIKMILWLAAIILLIGGLGAGALVAARSMDGPTLAARAGSGEFAYYQPSSLSKYFTEKELASPIDPAGFLAALHEIRPGKAAEVKKSVRAVQGMAYRCMMQPGCRAEVAKRDPRVGQTLPRAASNFFFDLANAGNEDAIRDICLLAAKWGTSYNDLLTAHNFCSQANYLHKNSKAGLEALSMLENSWAFRRAKIYDFADEVQYGLEHPSH